MDIQADLPNGMHVSLDDGGNMTIKGSVSDDIRTGLTIGALVLGYLLVECGAAEDRFGAELVRAYGEMGSDVADQIDEQREAAEELLHIAVASAALN